LCYAAPQKPDQAQVRRTLVCKCLPVCRAQSECPDLSLDKASSRDKAALWIKHTFHLSPPDREFGAGETPGRRIRDR
jgi:hypothetical protein